jgi:tol-pal system protein YbgF
MIFAARGPLLFWSLWALLGGLFMRIRNIVIFSGAVLAGALGGSLIGPRPAEAVAREIIELQQDVTSLLQGQKDMSKQMIQDHTEIKTLVGQSTDSANKLSATMSSLQKSVQDVQANSGARLDTMSTQVQGLSDNLEEIKSRLGKLNQQLVDLQNAVQSLDAKISGGVPAPATGTATPTAGTIAPPTIPVSAVPAGPAPSADTLYSNGLRDIRSGKYDLARSEFQDYLRYYAQTDLASNAQFYLGEIAYAQKDYNQALSEYEKVLTNYPKSFKLAPARLKKGMALIELGQKTSGVRELREVVKRYPGTEEDRLARAKLNATASTINCLRISVSVAPVAMRIPISRVRSVTIPAFLRSLPVSFP